MKSFLEDDALKKLQAFEAALRPQTPACNIANSWPGAFRGWGAVTKLYDWEKEK